MLDFRKRSFKKRDWLRRNIKIESETISFSFFVCLWSWSHWMNFFREEVESQQQLLLLFERDGEKRENLWFLCIFSALVLFYVHALFNINYRLWGRKWNARLYIFSLVSICYFLCFCPSFSFFLFYIFEMNQIIAENSLADKQKLFTHFQFFPEICTYASKLLGRGRIEEG